MFYRPQIRMFQIASATDTLVSIDNATDTVVSVGQCDRYACFQLPTHSLCDAGAETNQAMTDGTCGGLYAAFCVSWTTLLGDFGCFCCDGSTLGFIKAPSTPVSKAGMPPRPSLFVCMGPI